MRFPSSHTFFKRESLNNRLKLNEPRSSDKVSDFNLAHRSCPYSWNG